MPVGRGRAARPRLAHDRERLGGHERVDVDVVRDIGIHVGDIHPGGQQDQLIGLVGAPLRERQGDDQSQAPARAVAHENDPPAGILRDGAQVQVQDEPVRLLPGVVRRQRVERHDELGARGANEVVDEQSLAQGRRGDVAAAVDVDDHGVRRRVRAGVVDGHAIALAPLDVVEEPRPDGEGQRPTALRLARHSRDPVGHRRAGPDRPERERAVLSERRRRRAPVAQAGEGAEGARYQTGARHCAGNSLQGPASSCHDHASSASPGPSGCIESGDPEALYGQNNHNAVGDTV